MKAFLTQSIKRLSNSSEVSSEFKIEELYCNFLEIDE
jgi:hypothetical protein